MNELKGVKTEKKSKKQLKSREKIWKYIPFTLLFGLPF